ncbi:MAG TPA: hypothetical protein VMR51_03425 [Patescibacteria group bacterium]|nr:hypothetical protein [Patescibacteria group bacterium]
MKYLQRNDAFKYWDVYWNDANKEFFKVEEVQDYGAEEIVQSPSYEAWLSGDKDKSIKIMKDNANSWSKQTREKPILKRRIRIVKEPYTSYLEWEIMHYKLVNIPLGDEIVYLVNENEIPRVVIPGDFMIFDNERVANSHYKNGKMIGMDFYDKGEDISTFLDIKDLLLNKGFQLKSS